MVDAARIKSPMFGPDFFETRLLFPNPWYLRGRDERERYWAV